jgi:hypothetical protein
MYEVSNYKYVNRKKDCLAVFQFRGFFLYGYGSDPDPAPDPNCELSMIVYIHTITCLHCLMKYGRNNNKTSFHRFKSPNVCFYGAFNSKKRKTVQYVFEYLCALDLKMFAKSDPMFFSGSGLMRRYKLYGSGGIF